MMKPPIFPSFTEGTPAQQLMHRARMFKQAADELVAYSSSEQFLPKYALYQVPEGVTPGFPNHRRADSRWRTQEVCHGSSAPG
jgi:hypothetical protein